MHWKILSIINMFVWDLLVIGCSTMIKQRMRARKVERLVLEKLREGDPHD
jgi:hypothetical protein